MPATQLYQATRTLNNAEIKALRQTQILIVPTPPAGKDVIFVSGVLICDATAGIYTGVDVDYSVIGFKQGAYVSNLLVNDNVASYIEVTSLLTQLTVRRAVLVPYVAFYDLSYGLISQVEPIQTGTGISLAAENAADYTGGHASNTLKAIVNYTIIDV